MDKILQNIDYWVRSLVANPYFGIVGFLIGLIGLIFAYFVSKRDKREILLESDALSTNLIRDRRKVYPHLNITYNNELLDSFTITNIRITNTGTEIIRTDGIAPNDPIRFATRIDEDIMLLDSSITYFSDPNNNFSLEQIDSRIIQLNFDYIEPKDKVTIQLLHTGTDSKDIIISGTVIGAKTLFPSVEKQELFMRRVEGYAKKHPRFFVFLIFFIGTLIFGTFTYFLYISSKNIFISLICLLPTVFFFLATIKSITQKPDPDRISYVRQAITEYVSRGARVPYQTDETNEEEDTTLS